MDVDQCSSLIWTCYDYEQGLEEMKHSLLTTTWELEMTILSAKNEISRREWDLIQLKELLSTAIKERNDARLKCQTLEEENVLLLEHQKQQRNAVCISTAAMSSGSSESESHTSSIAPTDQNNSFKSALLLPEPVLELIADKPLPEKGRLLQAVMEAGPLLETVLLAGPLPQWQHPPPQLNFIDIPPVSISVVTPAKRAQKCMLGEKRSREIADCDHGRD